MHCYVMSRGGWGGGGWGWPLLPPVPTPMVMSDLIQNVWKTSNVSLN